MDNMKQNIIKNVCDIDNTLAKRTYLWDEYEKFVKEYESWVYTDEQLMEFVDFISEQKELLYKL